MIQRLRLRIPAITCVAFAVCVASAFAGDAYYVAPSGDDSHPGTMARPFRTIQRAVDLANAGTTVVIRGGRYHESVDLSGVLGSAKAPVAITAFPGESVTMDGTRSIEELGSTGWTRHQDHIYRTVLAQDVWQLFADGELMIPARWPNAFLHNGTLWEQETHWARIDSGKTTTGLVTDSPTNHHKLSTLPFSVTTAMAVLNIDSFRTYTRRVSKHAAGAASFSVTPVSSVRPTDGYYFLEGKLELLDSAREWFLDPATKALYFWTDSGEPPDASVRGKVQDFAFYGNQCSHVRIAGLQFFATAFNFVNSPHMTIEGCDFRFAGCSKRMLGSEAVPLTCSIVGPESGAFASVIDCTFRYSECHAVYLDGAGNRIENCLFERIDWSCSQLPRLMSTVYMHGDAPTFRRNTARACGASEFIEFTAPPLVELNDFSEIGLVQNDGAIVQLTRGAQSGSETRYNWFRNTTKNGARFDASTAIGSPTGSGGLMHHNISLNTRCGLMVKGDNHRCYNNTTIGSRNNGIVVLDDEISHNKGTVTRNNAAEKLSGHRAAKQILPGIHGHNWNGYDHDPKGKTPPLRDPDNLDFRPRPDSELVDRGTPVEPITDGFVGKAPDSGAYEFGDSRYWIPGRQHDTATTPIPPDLGTGVKSDADLMWLAGKDTSAHRVYFGTDSKQLAFQKRQANNIFSPGTLLPGTTYYWRVDEVTPSGTVTGSVWSFTVSANANPLD